MPRLHIGQYNVAMLDQIVQQLENQEGIGNIAGAALTSLMETWFQGPIDRVDPLCDQILDSPYDVICLNEVWDDKSRAQFIKRLSTNGPYKYYTEPLGGSALASGSNAAATALSIVLGPVAGLLGAALAVVANRITKIFQSSGLLVFSRHPFLPLAGDRTCEFMQYTDGEAIDRFAPKGGGAVVIELPFYRRIVIGFTHLQADYGKGASYPAVRAKQLKQWWDLMQAVAKKTGAFFFVACGDLNIVGNGTPTPPSEYQSIFQSNHPFSTFLKDQWLETHAPQDAFLTHSSDSQRLDYVLVGSGDPAAPAQTGLGKVTAHHLMLARNLWAKPPLVATPFAELQAKLLARGGAVKLSDHFGINAVLNFTSPCCSPRTAFNVTDISKSIPIELPMDGAYYWLLLNFEGTYLFNPGMGSGLEMLLFDPTDLSSGLTPIEPPGWTPADQRVYGSRFSLPSPPTYVRLRQLAVQGAPFSGQLKLTKVIGQSKKLADYLDGWRLYKNKPFKEIPNPEDSLWFELHPNEPTTNVAQLIQVKISWEPAAAIPAIPFELSLEDSTGNVLGKTLCQTPGGSMLQVPVSKPATAEKPWCVYARLKRLSKQLPPAPIKFAIEWRSNLTVLHGPSYLGRQVLGNPGPLELEATDETESDWLGSDEPTLRVTIDGKVVRQQSYKNVDSGDKVAIDQIAPVGYLSGLVAHLQEGSDQTEQPWPALGAGESKAFGKTLRLDIGNGNYELHYNLSHWLETSPPATQSS